MSRYEKEKQLIAEKIEAIDRSIVKLRRRGKYSEITSLVSLKKKYVEALKTTDNLENVYDLLLNDKNLNGWLSKTLGLAISMADLSFFYVDMANKFFERHDLLQSVETRCEMKDLCDGIQAFRKYYSNLIESQMKLQNFNLFAEMEDHLKESFYTDRERVFYNEFQEGC